MSLKCKIEELEEFKALSEADQKNVLQEYKKGYHFLLFYGKFFLIILMVCSLEYLNSALDGLPRVYRYSIYAVLGCFISFFMNLIEINVVAKRVIRDLANDIR